MMMVLGMVGDQDRQVRGGHFACMNSKGVDVEPVDRGRGVFRFWIFLVCKEKRWAHDLTADSKV